MSEVTVAIPVLNGGTHAAPHAARAGAPDGGPRAARVRLGLARRLGASGSRARRAGDRDRRRISSATAAPATCLMEAARRARRAADPGRRACGRALAGGAAGRLCARAGRGASPTAPTSRARSASPAVRMELERWFASLSPDGRPRVDRLSAQERGRARRARAAGSGDARSARVLHRRQRVRSASGLAAGAVSRGLLRGGPRARDRHAACRLCEGLRARSCRSALPRLHGARSSCAAALTSGGACARSTAGASRARRRASLGSCAASSDTPGVSSHAAGASAEARRATLAGHRRHHVVRLAGALLGSRADRLPAALCRRLSLEGRAGFEPLELDARGEVPWMIQKRRRASGERPTTGHRQHAAKPPRPPIGDRLGR